jgi:hypothetical protein
MKALLLSCALLVAACGNSPPPDAPKPPPAEPDAPQPPAEPVATQAPEPPAAPAPEAAAEKCDGNWVCLKVSFATRKVEKRDTKLLGDPKIDSTWSATSDGRAASFPNYSKGPVEMTFRRLPNDNNEVTVKVAKGPPISIDKHAGNLTEVTHVGAIATEDKDGNFLIDLSYQH